MKLTPEQRARVMRENASAKTVKKRQRIDMKIEAAKAELTQLQDACPHYNSEYQNKGNTGNWDRDDSYWTDWTCHDCGKRWTTDQDQSFKDQWPYAVKTRAS